MTHLRSHSQGVTNLGDKLCPAGSLCPAIAVIFRDTIIACPWG